MAQQRCGKGERGSGGTAKRRRKSALEKQRKEEARRVMVKGVGKGEEDVAKREK